MERVKETLKDVELFRSLPPDEVEALSRRCRWRSYSADEQIVGQADETRDIFFVLSGRVRVIAYAVSGKDVSFRDLGAGQMFGELAAIDGQSRSATVVALQESMLARMPAGVFWSVLERHPPVVAAMLRRLAGLVRALSDRVFEFSTLAVRNRIHAELLRLARDGMRDGRSFIISPVPTHAEIASRISTHREAVTRELNELARDGVIERRAGALVIRDIDRLTRMLEDVLSS